MKKLKNVKKEKLMISQTDSDCELRKLVNRRQQLRFRLQDHFSLPVSERNYHEFESVVDELEMFVKRSVY